MSDKVIVDGDIQSSHISTVDGTKIEPTLGNGGSSGKISTVVVDKLPPANPINDSTDVSGNEDVSLDSEKSLNKVGYTLKKSGTNNYKSLVQSEPKTASDVPASEAFLDECVGWQDQVHIRADVSSRYPVGDASIIGDNFLSPIYPYYFIQTNLGSKCMYVPRNLPLVGVTSGYGYKWSVNYRFSDGLVPKYEPRMVLTEKMETPLYTRKDIRSFNCCEDGDRYPVHVSAAFVNDVCDDLSTANSGRKYGGMFGGREYNAFYDMMQGLAGCYNEGENHIAYFVSMLRYYYSALLNQSVSGAIVGNFDFRANMVVKISDIRQMADMSNDSNTHHVECCVKSLDYIHFLTVCAQNGTTKYYSVINVDGTMRNVYDRMDIDFEKPVVIMDRSKMAGLDSLYSAKWPGDPRRIMAHIHTYAVSHNILEQLNDAVAVIRILTSVMDVDDSVSFNLPTVCHVSDFLTPMLVKARGRQSSLRFTPLSELTTMFMSDVFLGRLLMCGVNTLIEGAFSLRNEDNIDAMRFDVVMEELGSMSLEGQHGILDVIGHIVGLDLTPLRQTNLYIILFDMLYKYSETQFVGTLERLTISNPTRDSWAHWMRRPTVYTGGKSLNGYYCDNYEVIQFLKAIHFDSELTNIEDSFLQKPKCEYARRDMRVKPGFKLDWLNTIKNCKARIFIKNIDMGSGTNKPLDPPNTQSLRDRIREHRAMFHASIGKRSRAGANLVASNRRANEIKMLVSKEENESSSSVEDVDVERVVEIVESMDPKLDTPSVDVVKSVTQYADDYYRANFINDLTKNVLTGEDMKSSSFVSVELRGNVKHNVDDALLVAFHQLEVCGLIASDWLSPDKLRLYINQVIGVPNGDLDDYRWYRGHWVAFGKQFLCNIYVRQSSSDDSSSDGYEYFCYYSTNATNRTLYVELDSENKYSYLHKEIAVVSTPKSKIVVKSGSPTSVGITGNFKSAVNKMGSKGKKSSKSGSQSSIVDAINASNSVNILMYTEDDVDNIKDKIHSSKDCKTKEKISVEDVSLVKFLQLKKNFKKLDYVWLKQAEYVRVACVNDGLYLPAQVFYKIYNREWDTNMYSRGQMSFLESASPNGVKGVSDSIPRWVWMLRQIYTKIETVDYLNNLHNNNLISLNLFRLWHLLLFPGRPLPTHLAPKFKFVSKRRGCGCFACNNIKHNWKCGCETGDPCEYTSSSIKKENIDDFIPVKSLLPKRLGQTITKKSLSHLNRCFPFSNDIGGKKTNLDLGSLIFIIYKKYLKCETMWHLLRRYLIKNAGISNNLVTCVVMYLVGNTLSANGHRVLNSSCILGTCPKHFIEHFSNIHDEIRTTMCYNGFTLSSDDHSQLMYIHLMFGRLGVEVDWSDEEKKRTRKRDPIRCWDGEKWSIDEAKKKISYHIKKLFQKMAPRTRKLESLNDLFERRHEWMSSGAATGHSKVLNGEEATSLINEEVKTNELRVNKRSYAEIMVFDELKNTLKSKPIQKAFGHTKLNECAKVRAIFGVDLYHYFLHTFICNPLEAALQFKDISIRESLGREWSDILERQNWCVNGLQVNSYDFSDFNDQHELDIMAILHDCIRDWFVDNYSTSEYINEYVEVCNWISASFKNSVYYDKVQDKYIKLSGGMFSGNRATTLINSILNYAYLTMVKETCIHNLERNIYSESFRMGDDVVMKMNSSGENLMFNEMADKHNLVSNKMKLLSESGRCEYLRLMYYRDGKVLGSLCRCISTFINGNWESDVDIDPVARSQAAWEQCSVMLRRGLDSKLCDLVLENVVEYFSKVIHQGIQSHSVPVKFMSTTVKDGGLGLATYSDRCLYRSSIPFNVKNKSGYRLDVKKIPANKMKASRSLIKIYNKTRLPEWAKIRKVDSDRALSSLVKTTLGSELPSSRRNQGVTNESLDEIVQTVGNAKFTVIPRSGIGVSRGSINGSLSEMRSVLPSLERATREYSRIEKYKQIVSLVHLERGKTVDNLIYALTGLNVSEVPNMDVKIDRVDGGRVPPQLLSQINRYSAMYNINIYTLIEEYFNSPVSKQFRY